MMAYTSFEEIISEARKKHRHVKIAVAAAGEEHVLEAVVKAVKDGVIDPILVGDAEKIRKILGEMGETDIIEEVSIVHADNAQEAAAEAVRQVRECGARILMKGLLDTSVFLRAVLDKEKGLRTQHDISHMSITEVPGYKKIFVMTDGAILLHPTLEQKRGMIQNSVNAMRALGCERPNVAVITAIEKVNPKMPETVEAAALKKMNEEGLITGCSVEGPIALDLAFNKEAARIKGFESPVAGDADIIVMPEIVSGNIFGKVLHQFADSTVVGVAVGAKVPLILTSRGASVKTKYASIVVTSEMIEEV